MTEYRKKRPARSGSNRQYSVKKRKRRITITIILASLITLLLVAGAWFYFYMRTFSSYAVLETLDISNSDERTVFLREKRGYIKCASDGVTFFDRKGILWAETYEMAQPLVDVCSPYFVVADLKGSDIYVYDESGLVNRMSVSHPILDVEISDQGVVAAATNDGTSNYIEILDKDGNELLTAKSVFNTSGYLMDISMSPDGSSLAAAFIYVSEGTLESKVVFYDFAGEGEISGGFNQYKDTVVTNVEFMNPTTVCAVGDNAITIYKVKPAPTIVYEDLNLKWEIQSAFFDENRLGLVVEDETSDFGNVIKVYNPSGKLIMDQGTDFAWNHASFAGDNVLLYSADDCELYSFYGRLRFAGTFDDRIEYLLPCETSRDFIYATASKTQFIRIK
ncbi:MAG: hypothetical protein IKN57_01365 [Parasporobacterium sp.]|nr:hypothetical protein [Parasporobacterium sp.]MBR3642132.1 hypothetical protein [Parasporobacterium sp.]